MRQRIINFLLGKTIGVLIPQDIITLNDNGVLFLGENPITSEELKTLQSEAKALKSMRIWSILNETPKQKAFERGWKSSTNIEHLNIAKAEYALLDTQESIVRIILNK